MSRISLDSVINAMLGKNIWVYISADGLEATTEIDKAVINEDDTDDVCVVFAPEEFPGERTLCIFRNVRYTISKTEYGDITTYNLRKCDTQIDINISHQ